MPFNVNAYYRSLIFLTTYLKRFFLYHKLIPFFRTVHYEFVLFSGQCPTNGEYLYYKTNGHLLPVYLITSLTRHSLEILISVLYVFQFKTFQWQTVTDQQNMGLIFTLTSIKSTVHVPVRWLRHLMVLYS